MHVVDEIVVQRLAGEQAGDIARNGYKGAGSAYLVAIALGAILLWIEPAPPAQVILWLAVLALAYAVHVLLAWAYRRAPPPPAIGQVWCRRFAAVALAEGVIWGAGIVWFCATGPTERELVILVLAGAIASGVGLSFGSYMPAYWARFLPATVPYVIWAGFLAPSDRSLHEVMAACVATFIVGNFQLVRGFNASFLANQQARFRNLDLAEALRVQKDAAEAATLAKSRFLAAASHDLRQPVHGLSLFVGALHGAELPPATAGLLLQIEDSVTAIDGLFAALLDISRLDAGAIRVEPAIFPIQPLLERVVRDYRPEAAAKDVRMALIPCSVTVQTDPVLLERILRNLVSNAVRYTDAGSIVVGCRRGARLRVEIWDTGRGIPAEARDRIFDEFQQLPHDTAERRRGLGLGLAIVRRLSDLLGLDLSLCSEPGRGSRFAVSLNIATAAPPRMPLEAMPALSITGRILVVDDDPAIRGAMVALLTRWGHDVATAGSAAELEQLRLAPTLDLIICDYHVRGTDNGVVLIERMRMQIGRQVPAMLITADTSPAVLAEAAAATLLVLHKPVPNGRLRTAVGRLMAAGALV